MKLKKGVTALITVMAVSLLSGCGNKVEGEAAVQSVAMICGIGPVGEAERFPGVVVSQGTEEIKKDAERTITEVKVEVGDTVRKNEVLFQYDTEQAKVDLDKAKLELEQLKNILSSKKSEKKALEAEEKKATGDVKLQYTLEIQETTVEIQEAEYNVKVKESEIDKLEETLDNLEVRSPVKGQVQSINADGATDNTGNPLPYMVIVQTGSYRVSGYVNENNASVLAEGTDVIVRSRIDDSYWEGVVEKIDWESPVQSGNSYGMMDTMGGGTDEMTTSNQYPFYVELDDDEDLLLGQHVYIEVDYTHTDVRDEETEDVIDEDMDDEVVEETEDQDVTDEDFDDKDAEDEKSDDKEKDKAKEEKDKEADAESSEKDKIDIPLPAYYINDIEGKPWVWAQDEKGLLEKRSVVLGEYDEEADTYLIESGLELTDYIAFPSEELQVGMKCVIYDEEAFETDDENDFHQDSGADEGIMDMEEGMIPDSDMLLDEEMIEGEDSETSDNPEDLENSDKADSSVGTLYRRSVSGEETSEEE